MNIPIFIRMQLMQLRPTLLAIILIRHLPLLNNANASSMLPNTTPITRNKQASIIGLRVDILEGLAERWARIVLLTAYTARDLLFVYGFFVGVGGFLGSFDFLRLVRALAASRRFGDVFAGEGVRGGGFLVVR